jgi:hypothetical protein
VSSLGLVPLSIIGQSIIGHLCIWVLLSEIRVIVRVAIRITVRIAVGIIVRITLRVAAGVGLSVIVGVVIRVVIGVAIRVILWYRSVNVISSIGIW